MSFIAKQQGCKTTREWRAKKRKEWRDVLRAYEVFQLGCAYTPAYDSGAIQRLEKAADQITSELSPPEWDGRKYAPTGTDGGDNEAI